MEDPMALFQAGVRLAVRRAALALALEVEADAWAADAGIAQIKAAKKLGKQFADISLQTANQGLARARAASLHRTLVESKLKGRLTTASSQARTTEGAQYLEYAMQYVAR
jgi:hypothetical protein